MQPKILPAKSIVTLPGWPERNDLRTLIAVAHEQGALTDADLGRILAQIPPLLAERVERLTDGMSTSLPTERAERLMDSLLYQIGLALIECSPTDAIERLKALPLAELFRAGRGVSDRKIRAIARFMPLLRSSAIAVDHAAYQYATHHADRAFYSTYDPDWGAHELNWTPVYLPARPLPDVGGILYLQAYLQALHTENLILRALPERYLASVFEGGRRMSVDSPLDRLAEELDPSGGLIAENLCVRVLDDLRHRAEPDEILSHLGLRGGAAEYARVCLGAL